jgi:hypothetical protein
VLGLKSNGKKNYEEGTIFYLRWLPKGANNYTYESLGNTGLQFAQLQKVGKELELIKKEDA